MRLFSHTINTILVFSIDSVHDDNDDDRRRLHQNKNIPRVLITNYSLEVRVLLAKGLVSRSTIYQVVFGSIAITDLVQYSTVLVLLKKKWRGGGGKFNSRHRRANFVVCNVCHVGHGS